MIKVGLIGIGKMGLSHLAIFNSHKDVDVVAVSDPSKMMQIGCERFLGIKVFDDYLEMVNSVELDAVVISTPTKFHAQMVEDCLVSNLHVFCEKPFCLLPQDGLRLVQMANERSLINQVGYHCRFVGAFNKAKSLIEDGVIGQPYYFKMEVYGNVVKKKKAKTWRSQKSEGGGCLYDYASHGIDSVVYLLGSPTAVSGTVFKNINSVEIEDAVYSTIHYDNKLSGQLCVNWCEPSYRKMYNQITIIGEKGKIIADRQECKVYLNNESEEDLDKGWNIFYTTDLTHEVDYYLRGEEYSAQVDHFVDCIKSNNPDNRSSFKEAQVTDEVVAMLIKDAENSRTL